MCVQMKAQNLRVERYSNIEHHVTKLEQTAQQDIPTDSHQHRKLRGQEIVCLPGSFSREFNSMNLKTPGFWTSDLHTMI